MKRLFPDTLVARTLLALVIGLALSHAISIALYLSDRSTALVSVNGEHVGDRIAVVDKMVREAPVSERAHLLELADSPLMHISSTPQSAVAGSGGNDEATRLFREALIRHLSPAQDRQVRLLHMGMVAPEGMHGPDEPGQAPSGTVETMMVSLSQPDGSWLNFTVPVGGPETLWNLRFGLSLMVMLAATFILSAAVVIYLTRPLAVFAHAARRLGLDVGAPPLPVRGPAEIREASLAFNEMQGRIRRFVEDRTRMIAAISHDLGTPLARMRLRAEFIEDEEQRRKMLADLDDMEKMVFATLSFARDEASGEPHTAVDLRSLLQRLCFDATDSGHQVSLSAGDTPVPFRCQPVAMRRALGNLIDNAVKYGGQAEVSLRQEENAIHILIEDEGPGIPEARFEEVFQPFRRLEQSRNRETGGTGLGLTLARTIIRAHGGDIRLSNRPGGGLRVQVILPC